MEKKKRIQKNVAPITILISSTNRERKHALFH